jgi:hypothetical protein
VTVAGFDDLYLNHAFCPPMFTAAISDAENSAGIEVLLIML